MTFSFSKNDQERIYELIIKTGKELFYSKGYKNTTIKSITDQAGIASGSFYSFVASKEDLFMRIFIEEHKKISNEIIASVDMTKDPKAIVKEIFLKLDSDVRPNTVMGRLYNMNDFIQILNKLEPEQKIAKTREMYKPFLPFISKWQDEGIVKQIEPDMILSLFNSIFYIKMHKADIGEQFFPELITLLLNSVVEEIFNNKITCY